MLIHVLIVLFVPILRTNCCQILFVYSKCRPFPSVLQIRNKDGILVDFANITKLYPKFSIDMYVVFTVMYVCSHNKVLNLTIVVSQYNRFYFTIHWKPHSCSSQTVHSHA